VLAGVTGQGAAERLRPLACIIACMVALQIRDVPEELRDRLSELARQRGQSLQAYLFDVVSDEARRQDNLAVLDRLGHGAYGTRLSSADIDGALRAARAERDAELGIDEAAG
jgi:hypothetical protein